MTNSNHFTSQSRLSDFASDTFRYCISTRNHKDHFKDIFRWTCIVKIDIEMMGVRVTGLETEAGRQEEIITNETRAQTGVVHHTHQEGIGAVLQEGRGRRRKRGIIGREVITRMGQRGPSKVME